MNMRAAAFVQVFSELLALLESREQILEERLGSTVTTDRTADRTRGRLEEIRHLMNGLKAKRDLCQEEKEVCLGW
jgi:hypothetical protein